ncbi:uncharacterized protein LOC131674231 [Phymastichus coffea]|uniref:uncharacterized protein LOC131674231 n=1 Tax=Phymastichus coffea TaxID=108790 RepID=UPI00273B800B|nr:uncharacterized protein LOC131674231 [Phymastichus coffea]
MGIFSSSDQSGFDVAVGPCRAVLRFLGGWHDPVKPQTPFTVFLFILSTSTMFIFSCLVQTIEVFRGWGDLNYVIEILIIDDIPICVAVMKFIVSFYNKDILKRLVILMEKDWQKMYAEADWEIMWETARFSRKLSLVCILLAEGTITAQCMVVLMFNVYIKDENDRPLYMHSYFPFNTQISPNYEFTWFGQFMCTVYAASAFSSVDAFFGVLVLHLCGQLSVLKRNLKELVNDPREKMDPDEFTRKIAALVDRHDHLNMFAKTLEDSFNLMFLPQMIGTSLAMCLQGYQLVVISTASEEGLPLLQIFHMVYFTSCFSFSLFIYCYVAERLQFESTEIDYAAYQCDWYNWSPRNTRLLLLLMGRARKPLEITAGKFCVFSLGLYCSVRLPSENLLLLFGNKIISIADFEKMWRVYFNAFGSQKTPRSFDTAFGVTRWVMQIHGIWPGFSASKIRILRYAFFPSAFMILVFINIPQTVLLFRLDGNLSAILNVLTLANVPIGIALAKLIGVSFNQEVLQHLIVSISKDWETTKKKSELEVMWQKAKTSRCLSIVSIILGEGTTLAYTIRMFYVLFNNEDPIKPLYMHGSFPYDIQSNPNFHVTWVLQIIATLISSGVFSAVDALFISFVLHLCGQLTNLRVAFSKVGENGPTNEILREEVVKLGMAIFYCKLYNLPAKEARLLIVSLLRVKKPLEITAVLRPLILTMLNDWKSPKTKEQLQIMWRNAKISRLMSITIISLAEGTCVTYCIATILYTRSENKKHALLEENATHLLRKNFFKAEFFYDTQKTPQYEITWFFQCVSMFLAASAFSSTDALFGTLVLHLCSRLNVLRDNIKHLSLSLTEKWDGDSYNQILSNIIREHIFLERYAKSIEDAFNIIFLVQMIVCSVVICLQGYEIVMISTKGVGLSVFELIYMTYFILCFMFSLFVYCFVCEVLRKACMDIGDAAYEIDWYTFPVKNAMPLMMIILRAKKPFQITAGKFVDFCLELYCSILKTSGGYLSMLLAVKDRID